MNVVPLERCFGSPGKYRVPTTTRRQRDLALAGSIPPRRPWRGCCAL